MPDISRRLRFFLKYCAAALLLGGLLLVASELAHGPGDLQSGFSRFLEHLGVAFVVAAFILTFVDVLAHKEAVEQPLRVIQARVSEMTAAAQLQLSGMSAVLQQHATSVTAELEQIAAVAQFARLQHVSRLGWWSDVASRDTAIDIVSSAEAFVFVAALSAREMIVDDHAGNGGWLLPALKARAAHARRLQLGIVVLLADGFTEATEAGDPRPDIRIQFDGLASVKPWADAQTSCSRLCKELLPLRPEQVFCRLSSERMPFRMVMSEKRAIVEHYVPSAGTVRVRSFTFELQAATDSRLFGVYKGAFQLLAARASSAGLVLERYARHESGTQHARKEMVDLALEVKRCEAKANRDMLSTCLETQLVDAPAARTPRTAV